MAPEISAFVSYTVQKWYDGILRVRCKSSIEEQVGGEASSRMEWPFCGVSVTRTNFLGRNISMLNGLYFKASRVFTLRRKLLAEVGRDGREVIASEEGGARE